MLIPRSVLEALGPFDESFILYGEDLDIAARMRDAGYEVFFTPEVEIIHEIGVSTGRSRRQLIMHSSGVFHYYRKHRVHRWSRWTLPIAWLVLRIRAEVEWLRTRLAHGRTTGSRR
jgi:GT2 family glycosyltransferase